MSQAAKKKLMGVSTPDEDWLRQVVEQVLMPEIKIVDAHHHLWLRSDETYLMPEFVADLVSGEQGQHNVVASVFAECHSMYRLAGPDSLKSLGETEFVAGCAAMSDSGVFGHRALCEGIVGRVDMALGEQTRDIFEQHIQRSGGRFKGVRLTAAWDDHDKIPSPALTPDLLQQGSVLAAAKIMAELQLTLDCWVFHPQLEALAVFADQVPDLTIVLNHTGVPILGGPNRDRHDAVFADWYAGMQALSRRDNVVVKLGAVPIRHKGDGIDRSVPPGSEEIAASWARWMLPCIELFGAGRCMFESNFPVQKLFSSYHVTWNAFKRLAQGASVSERHALFHDCAVEAYRLPRPLLSSVGSSDGV